MPASDAGIGDPYWYEWSVGLRHVIAMLNPDSTIAAVTLQASATAKGLDDVHVHYKSGTTRTIQVKHTRNSSSFTFGDLVGSGQGESLLEDLSKAWKEEHSRLKIEAVEIHTNRGAGTQSTTITSNGRRRNRPALAHFWKTVKTQLTAAQSLQDLTIPPELSDGWDELLSRLNHLNHRDILLFLKQLHINTDQPSLQELTQELITSLSQTFGTTPDQSLSLLKNLDHALRKWATTQRGPNEKLSPELVFQELSSQPTIESANDHFFPPPEPFFSSRQPFISQLETTISRSPIVFLRGLPGAGKTSIISQLANRPFPIVTLRYHAFRPLSPSTPDLSLDSSNRVSPQSFWRELLDQLRAAFRGSLAVNRVPVRSDFLTLQQLRTEVFRLSIRLSEARNTRVVIAIDGIDHAARSTIGSTTFLETLPTPENLPPCLALLIAGQPANSYPSYPAWLRDPPPEVTVVDIPEISDDDISTALTARNTSLPSSDLPAAIRTIARETQRNTLAAVFAIEETRACQTLQALTERLQSRRLRSELTNYYETLWQSIHNIDASGAPKRLCAAAALSLLTVRVTPEILAGAFIDIEPRSEFWAQLLTRLQPLVVQDPGGFRVLHNDVRVFLTRRLQEHPDELVRLTSKLSRYAASTLAPIALRHSDAVRLLSLAGHSNEIAALFTPTFVLDGWTINRPSTELAEQGKLALKAAVASNDRHTMHGISCGLQTLSRLINTEQRASTNSSNIPPALPTERSVVPPGSWSIGLLRDLFQDIKILISSSEHDRARGLLGRWLGQVSPLYFASTQVQEHLKKGNRSEDPERAVPGLLLEWGGICGQLLPINNLFTASKTYRTKKPKNYMHSQASSEDGYPL